MVGKEEFVGNQGFLLFPQSFQPFQIKIKIFHSRLFCCFPAISIWTCLTILSIGKAVTNIVFHYCRNSTTSQQASDQSKLRVTMVGWNNNDTLVFTAISDFSLKVWCSFTGDLKHILQV